MPAPVLQQLGDLPVARFLSDYWQKKPLLIRQALPGYTSPISADELAGLALEEDVESRIIVEQGKSPWELRCGPFSEQDFQQLPADKWTLLVQAVDHWVPEVADLLDRFRFIPSWRLDDIMVSYAANGGSVGPHYDQYDVFLLQAQGHREWQLGQKCTSLSPCREDTELHILKEFHSSERWVLEPGDVLYLPPQWAHWGKAVGDDCLTFSVGFRAPSQAEIIGDFVQERLSELSEDDRYTDANLSPTDQPAAIDDKALARVESILRSALEQPQAIADWLGGYMTRPKYEQQWPHVPETENSPDLDALGSFNWFRNPTTRIAYHCKGDTHCRLYVNGTGHDCSQQLARMLGNQSEYDGPGLMQALQNDLDRELIAQLLAAEDILPELDEGE
ncbi:cupin domain-containing protein [Pseudomaricurvus alkylphenolicus]|uniref:cupin domain-containing protein n=1 Tax=Pseudomaricurvus alkylphenolicus TaxID=1306991 RepID=UPI001424215F|nr:cupin domain-containing protein [Pseudomaricurvus alkylphenolicus]NIB41182.1 cupin domain-containing protein [Pseudomaricurvus alkylphenolicus]